MAQFEDPGVRDGAAGGEGWGVEGVEYRVVVLLIYVLASETAKGILMVLCTNR